MARKFYDNCAGEEPVKLKTWFYALRAGLNARWVVEKEQMPPVTFTDSLSLVDDHLRKEILALIALKGTKNEDFLFDKAPDLLQLIQECITLADSQKSKLPGSKVNMFEMDNFFKRNIPKPKNDYRGAKKSKSFTV